MGTRNRERIARIEAGTEKPIRNTGGKIEGKVSYFCLNCKQVFAVDKMTAHRKVCK